VGRPEPPLTKEYERRLSKTSEALCAPTSHTVGSSSRMPGGLDMTVSRTVQREFVVSDQGDNVWRRLIEWSIQRPLIALLPLLVAYAGIILIAARNRNILGLDEEGYVSFAVNLTRGYYSPPDAIDLWWGPGYPLVLVPFVLLSLPWLAAKLLNALFLFGAVWYFYRSLTMYLSEGRALFFALLLGIYPPQTREIYQMMTEPFVTFLIAAFSFHFCQMHQSHRVSKRQLILASGLVAYLAITKVIFGYVIAAVIIALSAHYLWKREHATARSLAVFVLALAMCVPYLSYTYSLTGKPFYWGTSGGMSLYWMSSPYSGDLGDWNYWDGVRERWDGTKEKVPQIEKNHRDFFESIRGLDQVERDDRFKAQAIYNITHYPKKFMANWAANIGRLLFSYPFSYTEQKVTTYFYLLPNMFVVVLAVLCVYPSYRGRRLIPYEVACLLLVASFALVANSLVSAYERHFHVLVPIVGLWIALTLGRIVRIEIRQHPAAGVARTC
jgi:hypothetical protein